MEYFLFYVKIYYLVSNCNYQIEKVIELELVQRRIFYVNIQFELGYKFMFLYNYFVVIYLWQLNSQQQLVVNF